MELTLPRYYISIGQMVPYFEAGLNKIPMRTPVLIVQMMMKLMRIAKAITTVLYCISRIE